MEGKQAHTFDECNLLYPSRVVPRCWWWYWRRRVEHRRYRCLQIKIIWELVERECSEESGDILDRTMYWEVDHKSLHQVWPDHSPALFAYPLPTIQIASIDVKYMLKSDESVVRECLIRLGERTIPSTEDVGNLLDSLCIPDSDVIIIGRPACEESPARLDPQICSWQSKSIGWNWAASWFHDKDTRTKVKPSDARNGYKCSSGLMSKEYVHSRSF